MLKSLDRILVVDDCPDIRFLFSALLRTLGYEPLEAGNGAEALQMLQDDFRIRLVLTDYQMPIMDGLELTRRIRSDERLEDLPVLMQTSNALDNLEQRAAEAGVTKILPKPITPNTLMSEIERIVQEDGADHAWRALLVGLPPDSEATIRRTMSDAGFHVLQVPDAKQAAELMQKTDGVDLAFVAHTLPDGGRLIRVHLLRSEKDFQLFRLILLLATSGSSEQYRTGLASVAGYLVGPVSPEKVKTLLHRMGLDSVRSC